MEKRKVSASAAIKKLDLLSVKTQDITTPFYVEATCLSGSFLSSSYQTVTTTGSFLSLSLFNYVSLPLPDYYFWTTSMRFTARACKH
jgi:hypothetical protein